MSDQDELVSDDGWDVAEDDSDAVSSYTNDGTGSSDPGPSTSDASANGDGQPREPRRSRTRRRSDSRAAQSVNQATASNGESAEASANEAESAEGADDAEDDAPRRKRRRRRRAGRSNDGMPAPDERTQLALDFVTNVVREMEMDCQVRLRRSKNEESADEINIEIGGRDSGRIIGKKGQVLQALQFLTHRVVNRPGLERRHVLVDAEGYRSRRDDSLANMARRLGKQAVELGKIITFEPMNPRDRRVVHLALAKFEGVITKSDGEGDERRVQIIPVRR